MTSREGQGSEWIKINLKVCHLICNINHIVCVGREPIITGKNAETRNRQFPEDYICSNKYVIWRSNISKQIMNWKTISNGCNKGSYLKRGKLCKKQSFMLKQKYISSSWKIKHALKYMAWQEASLLQFCEIAS